MYPYPDAFKHPFQFQQSSPPASTSAQKLSGSEHACFRPRPTGSSAIALDGYLTDSKKGRDFRVGMFRVAGRMRSNCGDGFLRELLHTRATPPCGLIPTAGSFVGIRSVRNVFYGEAHADHPRPIWPPGKVFQKTGRSSQGFRWGESSGLSGSWIAQDHEAETQGSGTEGLTEGSRRSPDSCPAEVGPRRPTPTELQLPRRKETTQPWQLQSNLRPPP